MLVRYSERTGEVEVTGTHADFLSLVSLLTRGGGVMALDAVGSPEPYGEFLREVTVRNTSDARVSLGVTQDRELVIEGSKSLLGTLAKALLGFAQAGRVDEHLHVEYFPG